MYTQWQVLGKFLPVRLLTIVLAIEAASTSARTLSITIGQFESKVAHEVPIDRSTFTLPNFFGLQSKDIKPYTLPVCSYA